MRQKGFSKSPCVLYSRELACLVAQSCLTLCNPMDHSPLAPLSMGFSRQQYWSGLPCPPPGDLPYPGNKPMPPVSPALQADSLPIEPLLRP